MQHFDESIFTHNQRHPWNKSWIIGPKPPLKPRHVWAIRTRLQLANRTRDLALFNLAIDSKLRGCDIVSLKVEDIAPQTFGLSNFCWGTPKLKALFDIWVSRLKTHSKLPNKLTSESTGRAEMFRPFF